MMEILPKLLHEIRHSCLENPMETFPVFSSLSEAQPKTMLRIHPMK